MSADGRYTDLDDTTIRGWDKFSPGEALRRLYTALNRIANALEKLAEAKR